MDSHKTKVKQFHLNHAVKSLALSFLSKTFIEQAVRDARAMLLKLKCNNCKGHCEEFIETALVQLQEIEQDINETKEAVREILSW